MVFSIFCNLTYFSQCYFYKLLNSNTLILTFHSPPPPPQPDSDAHESPDSGINEHHPSPQASHQTSHQDSFCDQDSFDDNVEDDDDSDLQSVGLAKALYEFEGKNSVCAVSERCLYY